MSELWNKFKMMWLGDGVGPDLNIDLRDERARLQAEVNELQAKKAELLHEKLIKKQAKRKADHADGARLVVSGTPGEIKSEWINIKPPKKRKSVKSKGKKK